MIKGSLRLGGDIIEVVVNENNVLFTDSSTGIITTIEGLKITKSGVEKQFPDLKNNEDWRKEAVRRFKEHIKELKTENKKMDYLKKELEKHGYEPLVKQKAGWRPVKW